MPQAGRPVEGLSELAQKSILFELVNRKSPGTPVEAFILNIPPESMENEEPHRVTYTKTFGGLFVDDYGEDNMKITISGNTGGATLRRTYALDTSEAFTGKSAFFYLRNRLMRYKERRENFADFDLQFVDLSTVSDAEAWKAGITAEQADGYVVSLTKFKVNRSKEKPLFYSYSIELLVLRKMGTSVGKVKEPIKREPVPDLLSNIRKAINTVNSAFAKVRAIKNEIGSYISFFGDLRTACLNFFDESLDVMTYPLGLARQGLAQVLEITQLVDDIVDLTTETGMTVYKDALGCVSIVREMMTGTAAVVVYGKTIGAAGSEKIRSVGLPSRNSGLSSRYTELSEEDAAVPSLALSSSGSDSTTYVVYGYMTVTATASTTLESLALEHYGDASLIDLIALHNGILDDSEIVIGAVIKIPVLLQRGTRFRNFIYDEGLRDIYGKDIKLSPTGSLVIAAAGDFAVIEGKANLVQALNLRLNETLGARLRLTTYGIRASVGGAFTNSAPIAYLLASIRDTIMQDPRVANVSNLKVHGDGDVLKISFDIKSVQLGDVISFVGGIT